MHVNEMPGSQKIRRALKRQRTVAGELPAHKNTEHKREVPGRVKIQGIPYLDRSCPLVEGELPTDKITYRNVT